MSTAQRVSRGFYRLGLFLAVLMMLASADAAELSGSVDKIAEEPSSNVKTSASNQVTAKQSDPAIGKRDADHIELDELIQLYMLPAGVSYNVLGWETGSTRGTPILGSMPESRTAKRIDRRSFVRRSANRQRCYNC